MIELFMAVLEPPKQPLIDFVTDTQQTQTVEVVPQEKIYTIEEKIAMNYYNCNEAIEYIRADDATCLPRPQYRASESRSSTNSTTTPVTTQNTATAPSGWFKKGQCTWLVWTKRPVGMWNDATDWKWQAKRDGYTVSSTPVAGAIAWEYGHVAFVEAVHGDTVTITEANYDYKGSVRTVTVPTNRFEYIY